MKPAVKGTRNPAETRQRLLDATVRLVLGQGFNATTVEQICAEATVTKGSFFHHFKSKEEIGREAVGCFAAMGTRLYSEARSIPDADPLEQIHHLFDIMIGFTQRPDEPCVCMVGMMSQEMAGTNPVLREACSGHLADWAEMVRGLLADAWQRHGAGGEFDPARVAWFLNSLWQGSMLIAKTLQDPSIIVENLRLARAYVDSLFQPEFRS